MSIRNKLFMFKKLCYDLFNLYQYPISNDLFSSDLGEYYLLFDEERVRSGKDQRAIAGFDKNGIPLNRKYIDVKD